MCFGWKRFTFKKRIRVFVILLFILVILNVFVQLVGQVSHESMKIALKEVVEFAVRTSTTPQPQPKQAVKWKWHREKVINQTKLHQLVKRAKSHGNVVFEWNNVVRDDETFDLCPYQDDLTKCKNHQYVTYTDLSEEVKQWIADSKEMCGGRYIGYHHEFALLKDVTLDMRHCQGRKGGESIESVLLQSEESEYFTFMPGCVFLPCKQQPAYSYNNRNHLNALMKSLVVVPGDTLETSVGPPINVRIGGLSLLVTRYEYANVYHSMSDWYNAFLVLSALNQTQAGAMAVLLDGHPRGALDGVWEALFPPGMLRLGAAAAGRANVTFARLALNMLSYNSPLVELSRASVPMLEPFRHFFLNSFGIDPEAKRLHCGNVSILLVWRHDYVAHPRNPKGTIQRKIANEADLLAAVSSGSPSWSVRGVVLDQLPMRRQLEAIAGADVLVGMHGAALTLAALLPRHAGLVELQPNYLGARSHFQRLAQWRHLPYMCWKNENKEREKSEFRTVVPTDVMVALVKTMVAAIGC